MNDCNKRKSVMLLALNSAMKQGGAKICLKNRERMLTLATFIPTCICLCSALTVIICKKKKIK